MKKRVPTRTHHKGHVSPLLFWLKNGNLSTCKQPFLQHLPNQKQSKDGQGRQIREQNKS